MSLVNGDLDHDYDEWATDDPRWEDADFDDDEVVERYVLMMQKEGEEAHADPEFVEFFYGPNGLNMLALMLPREDGMYWVFDPIGVPGAPTVRRVAGDEEETH